MKFELATPQKYYAQIASKSLDNAGGEDEEDEDEDQ
jgi:hypothetical protein